MYEYILYRSQSPNERRWLLVEKDIILPEGFRIAEKCRVGFFIEPPDYIDCTTVSVSDEYWLDAYREDDETAVEIALSYLGGKSEADRQLEKLLAEWSASVCEWFTAAEAEELWAMQDIRQSILRGRLKPYVERGLVRKSGRIWLVSDVAMREVYGEPPEK